MSDKYQRRDKKIIQRGRWRDPSAERFATAGDAVTLLEQVQIYLGTIEYCRKTRPIEDRVRTDRFIG